MVPKTSDDLPDPETPVNTVSRRFGISTLMSLRLFSRAPWTRITSWLSAACGLEEGMGRDAVRGSALPGRLRAEPILTEGATGFELQSCRIATIGSTPAARRAGR